ncbi:hypothetical protein CK203_099867 [Vitis vinifera]|uniref:Uncharacterized protein n=1 Tax=Vitis vinifera TaxID=29760 RepID=A0A438DAF1_VITVI|nr:hypothetical protein CK203_099867 [Vitis vinifera]
MAALLYFEEKVHRKKLLRVDAIPLLFPRLLCQILEHLGYPAEPQLGAGLCHTFQALATSQSILTQQITALSAHQEQIVATQTQHTTILRQIQHHLGEAEASAASIQASTAEPSSPHHPPATI